MSIDEHVVEQQSVSLFDEITTKLGSFFCTITWYYERHIVAYMYSI